MRLMGIDASTKCTGTSYFEDEDLIMCHKIDLKKEKDTDNRVRLMLIEIIKDLSDYKPEIVYFEDVWTGKNPSTSQMLSQLLGGVWGWCVSNDTKFVKIKPASWRKVLGFKAGKLKRDELKAISVDYAKTKFRINVGDDEADAICIGNAGILLERND